MASIDNEKAASAHDEKRASTVEAQIASQAEHEISVWEALKQNRKAVGWSMLVSATIIMEGYDTVSCLSR